jgi:hypothetical protein
VAVFERGQTSFSKEMGNRYSLEINLDDGGENRELSPVYHTYFRSILCSHTFGTCFLSFFGRSKAVVAGTPLRGIIILRVRSRKINSENLIVTLCGKENTINARAGKASL